LVGLLDAYNISVAKSGGKRSLGITTCRWEHNIRMNIREIEWETVDWMHLAQARGQWWALVNMVMNHQVR
jgi:hypothetical protein